jgi:hypothetical protein
VVGGIHKFRLKEVGRKVNDQVLGSAEVVNPGEGKPPVILAELL